MRFLVFLIPALASAGIVADVKSAVGAEQFAAAETMLKQAGPRTPEWIEAYSWLARGRLAAKQYEQAEKYAAATRTYVAEELKKRPLDREPHLPLALGAAIEVHAQALAGQGQRDEALRSLRAELAAYRSTSIRARIEKNINLLSLEGKPAPALIKAQFLGPKPPVTTGKPTLLFFWAHWCGDCKAEGPVIAEIRRRYPNLIVIAPTQHYGYAEQGRDVGPAEELQYMERIRRQFYAPILDVSAPVSEETFKVYGVSTTPTLVLVDSKGIVRMYHPGALTLDELNTRVKPITGS